MTTGDEQRRRLEEALPIPWEKNPLVVFGFVPETVEAIRHRPQVLGQMARLMKKPLMLAHHADHTGSESWAQALNEAQAYLEDPYWQRTIIRQYLEQVGSAERQQKRQIEQLRERLNELVTEVAKGPRTLAPNTHAAPQDAGWWIATQLPAERSLNDYLREHQFLPTVLPAFMVLGNTEETALYFVDKQRRLHRTRQVHKAGSYTPQRLVDHVVKEALIAVCPKDDDSALSNRRAGFRGAAKAIKAILDRFADTEDPSELYELRRKFWWPDPKDQPKITTSEYVWTDWGKLRGQARLSEELRYHPRLGNSKKIGREQLPELRALVEKLTRDFESRAAQLKGRGAGRRFLFLPEWQEENRQKALRNLLQLPAKAENPDGIVLGSLPSDRLPATGVLRELQREGVSLDALATALPGLLPRLAPGNRLVLTSVVQAVADDTLVVPYVKPLIRGEILHVIERGARSSSGGRCNFAVRSWWDGLRASCRLRPLHIDWRFGARKVRTKTSKRRPIRWPIRDS